MHGNWKIVTFTYKGTNPYPLHKHSHTNPPKTPTPSPSTNKQPPPTIPYAHTQNISTLYTLAQTHTHTHTHTHPHTPLLSLLKVLPVVELPTKEIHTSMEVMSSEPSNCGGFQSENEGYCNLINWSEMPFQCSVQLGRSSNYGEMHCLYWFHFHSLNVVRNTPTDIR